MSKEIGHDSRHEYSDLYFPARSDQPSGNHFGFDRHVWARHRKAARQIDCGFPDHNGANQRVSSAIDLPLKILVSEDAQGKTECADFLTSVELCFDIYRYHLRLILSSSLVPAICETPDLCFGRSVALTKLVLRRRM